MQTNNLPAHPYISKALFCWLALLLGCIGTHWWLTGKHRAWFYLLCPPLAIFIGWADCIRYGLMPDTQFNARINLLNLQNHNAQASRPQTTATVIVAVVLSLAVFATTLMASLAMLFQWWFAGNLA